MAGSARTNGAGCAHGSQSPFVLTTPEAPRSWTPSYYGALAPHPWEWLHKGIAWQKRDIPVRGKTILMKFQVLGPFVREGLPEIPMFLFVVKGLHRKVGKKKPRWKHCQPSFYLVSAV